MSKFYISETRTPSTTTSTSSDEEDNIDTLPFATPLSRNDFLNPNFTPSTYLSTLSNRHQTLQDLRSELRARSQLLSAELLDLVNANYAHFLTLGTSLKGGDEKVEGVRVGLLGFAKEVSALEGVVREREGEVEGLVEERRRIRVQIEVGRRLVEVEERLRECEVGVAVAVERQGEQDVSDSSESEEDDEGDGQFAATGLARLRRNLVQFRLVKEAMRGLEDHPFVLAQTPRLTKVRSTLLLDLSTALQQASKAGAAGSGRVMQLMSMYADMEESGEAVKVLKTLKKR